MLLLLVVVEMITLRGDVERGYEGMCNVEKDLVEAVVVVVVDDDVVVVVDNQASAFHLLVLLFFLADFIAALLMSRSIL